MDAGDLDDYEELFESNTNMINAYISTFDSKDAIGKSQSLKNMK